MCYCTWLLVMRTVSSVELCAVVEIILRSNSQEVGVHVWLLYWIYMGKECPLFELCDAFFIHWVYT